MFGGKSGGLRCDGRCDGGGGCPAMLMNHIHLCSVNIIGKIFSVIAVSLLSEEVIYTSEYGYFIYRLTVHVCVDMIFFPTWECT
jgi:hypothetical protein